MDNLSELGIEVVDTGEGSRGSYLKALGRVNNDPTEGINLIADDYIDMTDARKLEPKRRSRGSSERFMDCGSETSRVRVKVVKDRRLVFDVTEEEPEVSTRLV